MEGRCLKLLYAFTLLVLVPHVIVPSLSLGFDNFGVGYGDAEVTMRCTEKEREALLAFKQGFIMDENNQVTFSSWGTDAAKQDCCRWKGVACDNRTGHVVKLDFGEEFQSKVNEFQPLRGKISSQLIELQHLEYLDLRMNYFNRSQIPDFIGSLSNLRYLDLSYSFFGGQIPNQLGNLTHLQYLDLTFNDFKVKNLNWLTHLSSLMHLTIDSVNLSNIFDWPRTVNNLPKLVDLTLVRCDLPSPIPSSLTSHPNSSKSLASVRLFINHFRNSSSIFEWLFNYNTSLVHLDLSVTHLSGFIPHAFSRMTSLTYLGLSYNRLSGRIPENIGQMSKLERIDVSGNSLKGVVSKTHFSKLSKLRYLDLSSNSLVLNLSWDWVPPFQLEVIRLGSCKMGSNFPKWLQTQKNFSEIDISDNGISDILPSWFWGLCRKVLFLDLSNNQIRGTFANLTLEFANYPDLNLSFNKLEGPIPPLLSKASSLDLTKNNLSGSVSSLCAVTARNLNFLGLSRNHLSGELPDSWAHFNDLVVLDLSNNVFSGEIPTTMGSLFGIETMKLNNNGFVGELPSSLKNCRELRVLDVGENKLSGLVPDWLGVSLSNLAILILRSNHFNGSMPSQLCHLTRIQLLDFSMNDISGTILKCFNNFTTLAKKGNSSSTISGSSTGMNVEYDVNDGSSILKDKLYEDEASLIWKGKLSVYKSTLGLLMSVDLSSNRLTGEIPREITELVGLVSLNLSRNRLTGQITPEIGRLQSLDSLDLSRNQIYGKIPTSVFQIHGLGVLDLSNNNLSGKIPIGSLLQTFEPSAYAGNPQLCGLTLQKICPEDEKSPKQTVFVNKEDEDGLITQGFYISMAIGFVVGFWGVCGTLIFNRSWRYGYFKFLNVVNDWVYVRVELIKRQRML
ncbi:hypothetical protein ACFX2I_008010 [Malus domestica]